MIYAFTGKTGTGKTYKMVQVARAQWEKGRDIYSNTILDFTPSFAAKVRDFFYKIVKKINFQYGKIIYFEDITEILEVKDGVILFDEAQVLFSSRQWDSLPEEFQYKLQQHRKHKLDLLCTTQNMAAIDIVYRRLVQYWFHHKRVFGLGDLFLGLFTQEVKDVDELYTSVDDLTVTTKHTTYFFIGSFFWYRHKLYNTLYDIGFNRFKTIWISIYNETTHTTDLTWCIIPKKMSLNDARKDISTLKGSSYNRIK